LNVAGIELEQLTKRYSDGTEAVKGIDLAVRDGEFMIFVGPSGCGKTTALRMIAGLEEITDGVVRVGERVVNKLAPKDRDIAMVFQNYALYPHMTVSQNIGFALKLAKRKKADVARRVEETASVLDLTEHLDRRPANLSGGQRQRVAIGRAIVRDPQVFLMDEPLSNLDAKLRVQMRLELSRLQARLGTTTVYVTHDQTEAMTLGDRLAVMHRGLIQQVGTPRSLYDDPANLFVAGFIGSPPISFVPAELAGGALRLPFGDAPLSAELTARLTPAATRGHVIAGIRPEAFEDAAVAGPDADGLRLRVRLDALEAMGAEQFAYFTIPGGEGTMKALRLPAANREEVSRLDARGGDVPVVARLDARSRAAAGAEVELVLRTSEVKLFDATSGETLLAPRASREDVRAERVAGGAA
jgi:multiple sugar transport system ATP-binding protein